MNTHDVDKKQHRIRDMRLASLRHFGVQAINDGSFVPCSMDACNEKATRFTSMELAGVRLVFPFCRRHARGLSYLLYDLPVPPDLDEISGTEVMPDTWQFGDIFIPGRRQRKGATYALYVKSYLKKDEETPEP